MGKKEEVKEYGGEPMKDFSSTTTITSAIGQYHEKDELYNPFDHREKKNANSDLGAVAHLIKSSLGTGILAMPIAVKNGGLLIGGLGTILIGIICTHAVHILVKSSHMLCRRTKTPQMTYAETAYAAFQSGPQRLRKFSNAAKTLVEAALCSTYVGGSCVYVVFIGESIKQLADHYTGVNVDKRTCMLMLIPALLLLGQIRNLRILVPFSVIANISLTFGFGICLYYIFSDIKPLDSVTMVADIHTIPKLLATVIFAIEGIGVVMPIENSMKRPEHFIGCPSVLNISMGIVIALYASIGVLGYLSFGEKAQASITLDLPIGSIGGQAGKILIILNILLTYGMQMYVPLEIMWNSMKHKFSHRFELLGSTTLRILIVLLTVSVAMLVPNLEPFISLVGALFFSFLGLTIPPVVETVACWESHLGPLMWRLWKNILLIMFSMLALIMGSWLSILDIIALYQPAAANSTTTTSMRPITSTTMDSISSTLLPSIS